MSSDDRNAVSLLLLSMLMLGCSSSDDQSATATARNTTEFQTAAQRPNILFIVGDDIGFGDLGVSGVSYDV